MHFYLPSFPQSDAGGLDVHANMEINAMLAFINVILLAHIEKAHSLCEAAFDIITPDVLQHCYFFYQVLFVLPSRDLFTKWQIIIS